MKNFIMRFLRREDISKCNRYPNNFVDFCVKKLFDKLYITKRIYQTVEKKQLLIILPFLDILSFETRNRLYNCRNNCIRYQLPFCLLSIAF